MKSKQLNLAKFKRVQAFIPLLVAGLLILTGAVIYNFGARAASSGFYFTSGNTTFQVGQTFAVGVYENSGTACTNVVKAYITYPADRLTYMSGNSDTSNFEGPLEFTGGNGQVTIRRYTTAKACNSGGTPTSGYSGAQLIGKIIFQATNTGNAVLQFQPNTIAINSVDQTNAAPGTSSKTFTLTAAPTPPPPGPNPQPAPQPAPQPVPQPAPQPRPAPVPRPVTSITPSNSGTSIPATNNDVVQTTTPVDVQPLPIQPDGINKIEYYLNGTLKATVKTAPYTYHLDTTKLLNGKYTLETKTYYSNGQTKTVSQTVIVKNPFGWTQLMLRLKKMAWLIILLLVLAGAAIAAWIIHRRRGGPDDDYYDGTYDPDDGYAPEDSGGPVVTPTSRASYDTPPDSLNLPESGYGYGSGPASDYAPVSPPPSAAGPAPSADPSPPASQTPSPSQAAWQPNPYAYDSPASPTPTIQPSASPTPSAGPSQPAPTVVQPGAQPAAAPAAPAAAPQPEQPANIVRPTQQPPQY